MVYTARAADGTLQDNLSIPQGAVWSRVWTATDSFGAPITLTNWTARAQIRAIAEDPTVLFEWNSNGAPGLGSLVLVGATVTASLTPAQSTPWAWRRGVYDLYLFDPAGAPTRLVKGTVLVTPAVTRG